MTGTVTALRFTLVLWTGSLFALLGIQRFFADPLPTFIATSTVFLAQTAPLLLVLPVVLRSGARGPLWLSLVTLLYFVHGIWQWNDPAGHTFGLLEVVFALGAFISSLILLKILPGARTLSP